MSDRDTALRALLAKWRAEHANIANFHATMGTGWAVCADELETALAGLAASPVPTSPDDVMDVYVPGCWVCPKCDFHLSKQTLFMASGDVGCSRDDVMNMTGELCPNDGEPMRRDTWRERAEDNRKWGESLMNDIIAATGAASLPDALARVKELASRAEPTPLDRKEP